MMDSGMMTALTNSVKDHFSIQSNSDSEEIPHKQPFVIGVAGGTASGKTTVCNMIISQLHDQRVVLVSQDSFYRLLSDEQLEKVHEYNFDHPDAFNMELLLLCMEKIKHGQAVSIPNYDVKSRKYLEPAPKVNPSDVIILEGILVLHDSCVIDHMNMKIFVDTVQILMCGLQGGYNVIQLRGEGRSKMCLTKYVGCIHLYAMSEQKHDFVFYADRLIRLVVEHGLGHLPFTEKQIFTPTGSVYTVVVFCKRLCGVSIIRSGESMENALRACCKGIKLGKILIHGEGNNGRQLIYEKLPSDISSRHVLLLDPVLASGNSAIQAISLLLSKGVAESNIIFLNLIAAPEGIHAVCKKFPKLKIVTSEIDMSLNKDLHVIPGMGEFGDRYFGTTDKNNASPLTLAA